MTNPTAVMTELDAVNQMLASIGQAPVNSLDVTGILDVATAQLSLDTVLREVLTKGWSFNTDEEYELVPNGSGHILIPATAMWCDPCDRSNNFVQRWDAGIAKFWDKEEHTYVIDVNPLKVNIVWAYEFTSIPQVARHYIAMRAARIWQSQVIGSDLLFKFTELHESEALGSLKKLEARSKQTNFVANSVAFHRRFNPSRF